MLGNDQRGVTIQGFETKKVMQSGLAAVDFEDYMAVCPQADVSVVITTVNGVQPAFILRAGVIRVATGWSSVTFGIDTLIELM